MLFNASFHAQPHGGQAFVRETSLLMLLKTYPAMFPHIYVKHKEKFFLLYVKYILYIYIIYINKNFALGRRPLL